MTITDQPRTPDGRFSDKPHADPGIDLAGDEPYDVLSPIPSSDLHTPDAMEAMREIDIDHPVPPLPAGLPEHENCYFWRAESAHTPMVTNMTSLHGHSLGVTTQDGSTVVRWDDGSTDIPPELDIDPDELSEWANRINDRADALSRVCAPDESSAGNFLIRGADAVDPDAMRVRRPEHIMALVDRLSPAASFPKNLPPIESAEAWPANGEDDPTMTVTFADGNELHIRGNGDRRQTEVSWNNDSPGDPQPEEVRANELSVRRWASQAFRRASHLNFTTVVSPDAAGRFGLGAKPEGASR